MTSAYAVTPPAAGPAALDLVFGALADPTRRAMLARIARAETSVSALTEAFPISQPAISKHLKVLERAGLVSRSRASRFRPVRLEAAPLERAARWIGGYQAFWEASFDRLEALAAELHGSTQPKTPKTRAPKEKTHVEARRSVRKPRR